VIVSQEEIAKYYDVTPVPHAVMIPGSDMYRLIIKSDFSASSVEPWFVAKDIFAILEVKNSRDALKHLDDNKKDTVILNVEVEIRSDKYL
jgi:prophage antirepressor-like protein